MGVPKFYRWLSERYPCLSQVIKEHQIPEFDNLYLDMNGIIHPCSHPNDDDPHFRITEAEIFKNIFNYIEVLFRIIKPKKNFFMAVDGCAPRAKMNQQRSRRFRTAKEAENNIRKALAKGQTLPKEDRFDSNCITPGTEFMARLQVQLQYFVNKKISTDSMWQNCNVYLSGHDVPGEGEHKVMDFIRFCKSQPGYDPNTRHCLYGLDADLIMLGLTSHEPHFALLREEVRFGKQAKRITKPEQQTFHLLHLSLLREYLEFEFSGLKSKLHFKYDIEKIIDDWILLGFLVGNDFIPHLPHLHINHDALPYLFGVYKDFLPTTDGYLHDGGYINLHRIKKFFEFLSKFDRDRFEEHYADLKWLEHKGVGKLLEVNEKQGSPHRRSPKKQHVSQHNAYAVLASNMSDAPYDGVSTHKKTEVENTTDVDVEIEAEETFELEFKQHKRHYYMEKFAMPIVDDDKIQNICHEYVRALQWIAHYYFNGLQSWSWYYPFHYAPYISDIANWIVRELNFDMAQAFHPFEQLLAVLPAASRKLLPSAFQNLMVMDTSPIIDFYPPDFQTDLNGKQQDWEAVVLVPFIDEVRLLTAMEGNYARLTDEEKARNMFGQCFKYNFDSTLNFVFPTTYPEVFEDIRRCRAKKEEIDREGFHLDVSHLKKGLMEGTKLDVYFPGFPTMKHLQHKCYLKKAGVKVFQYNSRSENMIVKIIDPAKNQNIDEIARQLVGEMAHVDWPYMVEGRVMSVCDDKVRYSLEKEKIVKKLVQEEEYESVKREMKSISSFYMNRKGVELGTVNILVEAKLLLGKRYICGPKGTVTLEKEYAKESSFYGGKAIVKNLSVHSGSAEKFDSIETLYPPGSTCFMMASPHYGCAGEVIEFDGELGKVRLSLKVFQEPNFESVVDKFDTLSVHYLSEHIVSQKLGISTNLLNRMTGDLIVGEKEHERTGRVNIGLKLKYTKQKLEALGFARYVNGAWTYSPQTVEVIREYMKKYPEVFETVGRTRHDNYILSHFTRDKNSKLLTEIKAFLKTLPCHNVQTVRSGSNALDKPIVENIHSEVELSKKSNESKTKVVKVKVKPTLIFRPTDQFGKLSPDPETNFLLLDRVVNVESGITVPIGLRGTIVGIHKVLLNENDANSPIDTRFEVLFDTTFLGANQVRSVEDQGYFMNSYSLINLSYGERKEKLKKRDEFTRIMTFQKEITSLDGDDGSSSQYSQRTPGGTRTSDTNRSSSSSFKQNYRGRLGPNQQENDRQAPSQDFWLKGRYESPQQRYESPQQRYESPQQQQQQQRRSQQQNYSHQQSNRTPQPRNNQNEKQRTPNNDGGNDFMNMWKELQKEETGGENKVDQNATNILHQILQIKPSSPSPQQQQQQQQQRTTTQQSPQLYQPPNLLSQLLPNQHAANPMVQQQQQQHQQQQQQHQLQQQQHQLQQQQQHQQQRVMPPFMQPSMVLLQYCLQFNLPKPEYLFSKSPQGGFSALLMIDTKYKFAGQLCRTQQEAMENVSSIAIHQLTGQPFMQPQIPIHGIRPVQPGFQHSPQQFVNNVNSRNNYPNQQQHQQQRNQQDYIKKSQSDTSIQSTNKQPQNMFVPHQVAVKNIPKDQYAGNSPGTSSHTSGTSTNQADNELKKILGIQSKQQGDSGGEDLKKMLGINNKPTPPQENSGGATLKNILGVKSAGDVQSNSTDTNSFVSDEEKLKSLIGIKTSATSTMINEPKEVKQSKSEPLLSHIDQVQQIKEADDAIAGALANVLANCNISTNIGSKTPDAKKQPEQKDNSSERQSNNSSPAISTKSTSPDASGTTKPKKPITLAASFLGPKKK